MNQLDAIETNLLWDMAGQDSLLVARSLFGEAVSHLASFQSLETTLQGSTCSVLRLCDRNFRIAYPGPLARLVQPLQAEVWVKHLEWMTAIALPDSKFPQIVAGATARPPHRLDLPLGRASPAQLKGIPVVLWRHVVQGQPVIELHLAQTDADALLLALPAIGYG